jgi:hypothetical protein
MSSLGQEDISVEVDAEIQDPSRVKFGQQARDRINIELAKVGVDPIPVPGQERKSRKDNFGVGIISLLIILFLILS